jgi:hypothetical protein
MTTIAGSRSAASRVVRRLGTRRHLPTICFASIVIALQQVPSLALERGSSDRVPGSPTMTSYELTVRLCLVHGPCGSAALRIATP